MSVLRVSLSKNFSTLNYVINSHLTKINITRTKVANNYGTAATSVVKSPDDINIPNVSVTQLALSAKEHRINSPAVTCGLSGRSYTYGMIKKLVDRGASALIGKVGLKPGDTIGLMLPNIPECVIAIHAGMSAGLTVTFVNPLYTEDEVARQFQSAGVKCIMTIPELLELTLKVANKLPNYLQTISVGGEIDPSKKIMSLQALLAEEIKVDLPEIKPSDVAALPFSSGTTGPPKGVMLTHRNLVANLSQCNAWPFNNPPSKDKQEIVFSVLPFFHIYGFNTIMNMALFRGEHLVVLPQFKPEDYLSCLIKYRPSSLLLVPSLVLFLASHPAIKSEHLSSVDRIICGAAPASKELIDKFTEKLGHEDYSFSQGFGMTETSPVTISMPLEKSFSKSGSCGRLLPSTSARIVDLSSGKDVGGPNKSGELWIKGPQVMKGYLNNPKATAETLDEEGWLRTGDVAYYDDDEFFFITGRAKELIKVKGNQVSPTELESIILQIPGVADVAVIGIPDAVAGELPRAFVVKKADAELTEEAVTSYLEPKVTAYKRLAGGVIFIDAIPRNASGKILRHELKALDK